MTGVVGRAEGGKLDCFRTHGNKTLFKRDDKGLHFVRAGCKSWSCSRCGPCKAKSWVKAVHSEVSMWRHCVWASLTMEHGGLVGLSFVDQDRLCMPVWGKFLRIVKVAFPGIACVMSKEPQASSGVWSLNVLLDRYIPQAWLSKTWVKCGGGKIVWIKRAALSQLAYHAKYFTKYWLELPPSFKRYSTTRGISLTRRMKGAKEWRLIGFPIWLLRSRVVVALDERSDGHGVVYFRAPPDENLEV